VSHATDFHQFMLYTPLPGTPLHAQLQTRGLLFSEAEFSAADTHGQYRFNYRHPHIPAGSETELLRGAFQQDFAVNGPSLFRMFRTKLRGWQRHKHHPDARVRARFQWEARGLATSVAGAVWAMHRWYRHDDALREKTGALLRSLYAEFGWKARISAPLLGRIVSVTTRREARRLERGWTYEPPVVYEKNERAQALDQAAPFPAVISMPRLQTIAEKVVPTFAVFAKIKARHCAYRQARILRKTYRVPVSHTAAAALWERSRLRIKAQLAAGQSRLLRLDLHGVFNGWIGRQFRQRIEDYLRDNTGHIVINFSGLTAVERAALLRFLKTLRSHSERIKLMNLDALKADVADVVAYARTYFDVTAEAAGAAETGG